MTKSTMAMKQEIRRGLRNGVNYDSTLLDHQTSGGALFNVQAPGITCLQYIGLCCGPVISW